MIPALCYACLAFFLSVRQDSDSPAVTCGAPSYLFEVLGCVCRLLIYLIINIFLLKNLSVYAVYYVAQKNPRQSEATTLKYVRAFCTIYFLTIIFLEAAETVIEFNSP